METRILSFMSYKEYLESEIWKANRVKALQRAGRRCAVCGSRGQLHVHHNTYENLGRELPEDLCVLCSRCHEVYETDRLVREVEKA